MVIATIPLSAFRVPDGKLAVTFDLHALQCRTAVLDTADLERLVKEIEVILDLSAADRGNVRTHVRLRVTLSALMKEEDLSAGAAYSALGLWLALNHPMDAGSIRTSISRSLRGTGRAQLTIASDARGMWGFTMSKRPADLTALMASMPSGTGLHVDFEAEQEESLSS